MKRVWAALLFIGMIFSLCACGEKDISSVITQIETSAEDGEDAAAEAKDEVQVSEEAEEPAFGVRSGNEYENSFFGIGCELDDTWIAASDEELAALLGKTVEMFTEESLRENLRSIGAVYDFSASRKDGAANINVILQTLGNVSSKLYSVDDYVDAAMETMGEQLATAGFSEIEVRKVTAEFAGEKRTALYLSSELEGFPYYCLQTYVKVGEYLAVISFGSFFQDDTKALAELFYPLD